MTAVAGPDDTGSLWKLVHSCGGGLGMGLQNHRQTTPTTIPPQKKNTQLLQRLSFFVLFLISPRPSPASPQPLCVPASCRPCRHLEARLSPWVCLTNGRELGCRDSRLSLTGLEESWGGESCLFSHPRFRELPGLH